MLGSPPDQPGATAFAVLGVATWRIEPGTQTVIGSPELAALLGLPAGAAVDRAVLESALAAAHGPELASLLAGERSVLEVEVRAPGASRWLRLAVGAPDASGVVAAAAIDISTQRAIDRERELLHAIARRTDNAVIVARRDGSIEWVNDGFMRLTGFTPAEAIGQHPGALLQGPDTSPEARAQMRRARAVGEPFALDVLNYAKSGRQYWVHIDAQPTRDTAGQVTGYIAVMTDVTERRVAAAREHVAQAVASRLLTAVTIEAAAQGIVDELVQVLDVRTAQLWLVEPGQPHLQYLVGACADADSRDYVEMTRAVAFRMGDEWVVGVGAPGYAWGTGRPCVKSDFWEDDRTGHKSRRAASAMRARIRTVCAVPIRGPRGVMAVLEVGGSHSYPGHERLPSLIERIGEQLASFMLQLISRQAFEALFQHSPDALLLIDERATIQRANLRACTLFGMIEGQPLADLVDDPGAVLAGISGPGAGLLRCAARRPGGGAFPAELASAAVTADAQPGVLVAVRDLTERLQMEEALTRSLREKVTLVQEVHHRVKNNLQIISSLVSLQANELDSPEVRDALADTANRVQSMALVHQQLYSHDDVSRVPFDQYLTALGRSLQLSLDPSAELEVDLEPAEVDAEFAVPCGLIVNELMTNAIKHGRSADGRCRIRVTLSHRDGELHLEVADRGQGPAVEPRAASMGST
ncbi:MAG: PAS domain S-box protein, partial [Proteobacteria bacterium]|nr:PAS domain S-box protein [Pseudomonadota bacterium]